MKQKTKYLNFGLEVRDMYKEVRFVLPISVSVDELGEGFDKAVHNFAQVQLYDGNYEVADMTILPVEISRSNERSEYHYSEGRIQ